MTIRVEHRDQAITELVLDDRAHQNALTDETIKELLDALERLRSEPGLKVLLATGRPEIFCSGAPLERLRRAAAGAGGLERESYWSLLDGLTSFPLPVVVALEGHAVGGGLMLALLLGDMLVAADTSRYGLNFSTLGFTPGMGASIVIPRLVGPVFAAEMLLGGKLFTGHELRHRGLFNHVAAASEVHTVALDLARRVAEKPRYVLELLKQELIRERREGLEAAVARECELQEICLAQDETKAMIETMYRV